MRVWFLASAALAAAIMPVAAMADDPHDPAMRSAAARQRDHETIRRMNLQQLAMVRKRDAQYAQGWQAARDNGNSPDDSSDYEAASRDHDQAMADYARNRAKYQRDMADWRRAVIECREGNYDACDN